MRETLYFVAAIIGLALIFAGAPITGLAILLIVAGASWLT